MLSGSAVCNEHVALMWLPDSVECRVSEHKVFASPPSARWHLPLFPSRQVMLFKHRPDPLCAFSCKGDSFPICKVRETALCAVGQSIRADKDVKVHVLLEPPRGRGLHWACLSAVPFRHSPSLFSCRSNGVKIPSGEALGSRGCRGHHLQ